MQSDIIKQCVKCGQHNPEWYTKVHCAKCRQEILVAFDKTMKERNKQDHEQPHDK